MDGMRARLPMSSINSQRLLAITPEISERQVATLIAEYMVETERLPYWFSINHDVRPPKCLACPIGYDWASKARVGIKTSDKRKAWGWIKDAVMLGYEVRREGDTFALTSSIAIARRRAETHQRPPLSGDDDIPF
jgi:hypothetical protein